MLEEKHDWSADCEKCAKCGHLRNEKHIWVEMRCSKCGKDLWEIEDVKFKIAFLANIEDQKFLTSLAIEYYRSDRPELSLAIVEKLTDQELLKEIAIRCSDDDYGDVRYAAVEKLTDQSLLAEVAENGNDLFYLNADCYSGGGVAIVAIRKLNDKEILEKLAVSLKAKSRYFELQDEVKSRLKSIKTKRKGS